MVPGLLIPLASLVVEHGLQQLWCLGLIALWHVKSSGTRDRTHVPCIGRRILNCWATKEAQGVSLGMLLLCDVVQFSHLLGTSVPPLVGLSPPCRVAVRIIGGSRWARASGNTRHPHAYYVVT